MLLRKRSQIMWSFLVLSIFVVTGCSDNSSDNPPPETRSWQDDAVVLPAIIELPDSSPLNSEQLALEVFDQSFPVPDPQAAELKTLTNAPSDVYLMLPPLEGEEEETVYLFATVLPGEQQVVINVESTAIGLVMNGIPQYYLLNAGNAEDVKQAIAVQAAAFISQFSEMIENEPYVLKKENLSQVYDAVYIDSSKAALETLRDMIEAKQIAASQESQLLPAKPLGYSMMPAYKALSADEFGEQFSVTPSAEQQGFTIIADTDSGKLTGKIKVDNDTRLYANVRVTNTFGTIIQDIPTGLVNSAFNPTMLGSQSGFWGGFASSQQTIDVGFSNVTIDIETGGTLDPKEDYLATSAPGLMARSAYSNFVLPVIGTVLPVSDLGQTIFGIFAEMGAFDGAVIDAWQAGDASAALTHIINNVKTTATLSKIIEITVTEALDTKMVAKLLAKLGLKLAAIEVTGAITAAELFAFEYDLKRVNPVLTFYVNFPLTIDYITPEIVDKKITSPQTITVAGHGFTVFTHQGTEYAPTVELRAVDKKGEAVSSKIYDYQQGELQVNQQGTEIKFDFPLSWLGGENSLINNIAKVNIKLSHHYIEEGYLYDELRFIELPTAEQAQDRYQLSLLSELVILKLSKSELASGKELTIYGQDFADEAVLNQVYLAFDRSGYNNPVAVDYLAADGSYLKVTIPERAELNLLGKAKVFVELEDGTQSNKLPLVIIPEQVSASPNTPAFNTDTLSITLSAQEPQSYIMYSIDGGTEQLYTDPIEIDATSQYFAGSVSIVAHAYSLADGVTYKSDTAVFNYTKCASNEVISDGQCVQASCNRVCDNPVISNVITFPGYAFSTEGEGPLSYHLSITFDTEVASTGEILQYKYCTTEMDDDSADNYNDKKTMLYFYEMAKNADGSWDVSYRSPHIDARGFSVNASLSVDIPYKALSVKLLPKEIGMTSVFYAEADNFMLIGIKNYQQPFDEGYNELDFARINVRDLEGVNYSTFINPEFVDANGCYTGDY